MCDVVFTAASLALPDASAGQQGLEAYVMRLLDWGAMVGERWLRLLWSERSVQRLMDCGRYPITSDLGRLCGRLGVAYLSVNDVRRIVGDILSRTPTLEEHIGISDVVWRALVCEPDVVLAQEEGLLRTDLERIVALIAYWQSVLGAGDQLVVTTGTCPGTAVVARMTVVIDAVESLDGDVTACDGSAVSATVHIADGPARMALVLDECRVWTLSGDGRWADTAIRIRYLKDAAREGLQPAWSEVPAFRIGRRFWESAVRLEFDHDRGKADRLLGSISRRLLERHHPFVHGLRAGAGAMDPPVTRGPDRAMRMDVDYEFHLHYWETGDGPEFAVVVTHNDFSIPD